MNTSVIQVALERRLEELIKVERNRRAFKVQVWVWLLAAAVAAVTGVLISRHRLGADHFMWKNVIVLTGMTVMFIVWRWSRVDVKALARDVEAAHPELKGALLAALEQKSGADGSLGYLQERVIEQVLQHRLKDHWADRTVRPRATRWMLLAFVALGIYVGVGTWSRSLIKESRLPEKSLTVTKPLAPIGAIEIAVTPGDAEVERGSRLVVEAKFPVRVPDDAVIVLTDSATHEERARYQLKPTVDDHVFGGMIPNIEKDGVYRVEFAGGKSDDYKITTYVHPELLRADAKITPPAYTGLPEKEMKNTRNVTALEGSKVAFRLAVNKPIVEAELYGEDKTSIPLKPSADDPLVLEATMIPEVSQKYRVHLVDDHERANKQPPSIKIAVQKNQPPKIDIIFPKRDLAVSPIQELPLEAKVWDDVGVQKVGAVFSLGGQKREVMLNQDTLKGGKPHELRTMLELEQMKAQPKQLVSYYLWAEDSAADGKTRRTLSDMFFAEVRHFEDIFREKESPPGEDAEQEEGKGQVGEVVKLQKDVVNATWRLIRDTGIGKTFDAVGSDVGVVKEGQDTAKEKTEEMIKKVKDAEIAAALRDASTAMAAASDRLKGTIESKKSDGLTPAMDREREALEALYRAQSREHQVMRSKPSKKGSESKQSQDKQVMQLELKQKEQRYEETKEAKDEKTKEQQENLQVLNRLKELARRQEALAEKIKELETQLQQAKSDQEKKELERQLKRLQEEQEQLLRDLDDLKERVEKPENKANMAEESEKLDSAREKLRDAADKLKDQKLADAANAATRAQRDLEQARDDFRQRTSKRFGDEMKQLKQQANDLAQNEEKLAETLQKNGAPPSNPNNESNENSLKRSLDGAAVSRQLDEQRKKLDATLEEMKRISEAAEAAEPLLSGALYDAVRKAQSTDVDKALQEARDHAQYGNVGTAQTSERKAAQGIDDLKKGIDKAAESVLGSETEALRMARTELDRLMRDVESNGDKTDKSPATKSKGSEGKLATGDAKDGKAGESNPSDKKGSKAKTADAPAAGEKNGAAGQPESDDGKDDKMKMADGSGKDGEPQQGKGQARKDASQTAANDGKEQKPGEGKGEGRAPGQDGKDPKMAEAGNKPGSQPGQTPGAEKGDGSAEEKGQQAQAGGAAGQKGEQGGKGEGGQQPGGQGQGRMASAEQGQPSPSKQKGQSPNGRNTAMNGSPQGGGGGGGPTGGDDRRRSLLPNANGGSGGWFFDETVAEQPATDPLTGENFAEWTDRLRRVEEALDDTQLRNQAARVQDSARELRIDYRRNNQPPQSSTVATRITQPLAELRDRVNEELAKRESKDSLAPLDRDPVPNRYRELVRRYYTELGTGR